MKIIIDRSNEERQSSIVKEDDNTKPKEITNEFTFAYMGHIIRFSILSELETEELVHELLRQLTKGELDKFIKLP